MFSKSSRRRSSIDLPLRCGRALQIYVTGAHFAPPEHVKRRLRGVFSARKWGERSRENAGGIRRFFIRRIRSFDPRRGFRRVAPTRAALAQDYATGLPR